MKNLYTASIGEIYRTRIGDVRYIISAMSYRDEAIDENFEYYWVKASYDVGETWEPPLIKFYPDEIKDWILDVRPISPSHRLNSVMA